MMIKNTFHSKRMNDNPQLQKSAITVLEKQFHFIGL